jgi:hypothetical protein
LREGFDIYKSILRSVIVEMIYILYRVRVVV